MSLGYGMDNSDYAHCERLCKSYRENGCCYLKTGEGCYWRPGGYSTKSKVDNGAISVNCYRSGRNRNTDFDNHDYNIYNNPSSKLMLMYFLI